MLIFVGALLLTTGCINNTPGECVISQQQEMDTNNSGELSYIKKWSAVEGGETLKEMHLSVYNKREKEGVYSKHN